MAEYGRADAGFVSDLTHLSMDVQAFSEGVIVWQDQRVHFRPGSSNQIGRDFGDSARSQRKFQAFQNDYPIVAPSYSQFEIPDDCFAWRWNRRMNTGPLQLSRLEKL
jgi:hypothetical protein